MISFFFVFFVLFLSPGQIRELEESVAGDSWNFDNREVHNRKVQYGEGRIGRWKERRREVNFCILAGN